MGLGLEVCVKRALAPGVGAATICVAILPAMAGSGPERGAAW